MISERHQSRAQPILWLALGGDGVVALAWVVVYRRVWMVHVCLALLVLSTLTVHTHRRWSQMGAASVLLVSLLTGVEYLFGVNVPIDQLLVAPDAVRVDHWTWPPGRMSVMSTLTLPWLALALLHWQARRWWLYLAPVVVFMYAVLMSHVYQLVGQTDVYVAYVNMGRSTALITVLVIAGIIVTRDEG